MVQGTHGLLICGCVWVLGAPHLPDTGLWPWRPSPAFQGDLALRAPPPQKSVHKYKFMINCILSFVLPAVVLLLLAATSGDYMLRKTLYSFFIPVESVLCIIPLV